MSHEGKLRRGKIWLEQASLNPRFKKEVEGDPNKMCDVNYYLDSLKENQVDIDWSSRTVAELKKSCETFGISIPAKVTKDQLISLLENKDKTSEVSVSEAEA